MVLVLDKSFVDGSPSERDLPETPNFVGFHKASIAYRESDQSDKTVVVPSRRAALGASDLARQPS